MNAAAAAPIQPQPPLPQGYEWVHKQPQMPNLSPDSSFCGGGVAEEDSFSSKFGWRSSKQVSGTPIKKLLAQEMTPKAESKRRSPGVIARLMGLDGLPFQQPSNKQHKGFSETLPPPRTMQLEKTQSRGDGRSSSRRSSKDQDDFKDVRSSRRSSKDQDNLKDIRSSRRSSKDQEEFKDVRSSTRSSKDQEEFKDVFEVSEMSKVESGRHSSHGRADLKTSDAEMSFIEQKFMDAKRLATYQDLHSSKEFRDTLEVLDSNKDLLLKYFKRPDSLFKKHLNDLQAPPHQSHFEHLEATNTEKYERDLNWMSDREAAGLNYKRLHPKHRHGFPRHDKQHLMSSTSPKSSKDQFIGNHGQGAFPTKIVVLKPNLGKVQNGTRVVSSPYSSHKFLSEHGNHTEFSDARFRDTKLYQTTNLPDCARICRQDSLESRDLAKEITRQVKNSLKNGSVMLPASKFRGYAGDDSSCCVSGNESPEESEETTTTLGSSFDFNSHSRYSSHSSESSVSREAKKRLSERWKRTHKSQEAQVSRSSTLAEMLANHNNEMKAAYFDSMASGDGFHDEFARHGESTGWVEPMGISSRDGWKDGCIGTLSRSKSLPNSSTAFGSPRMFLRTEALRDDRFMVSKEALKRERKRTTKNIYHSDGVSARSTKSGHKKSMSLHSIKLEGDEFFPDFNTFQNEMKINVEEDSPKLEVPATLRYTSAVADDVVDAAIEKAVDSSESSNKDLSAVCSDGSSVSSKSPVPGLESSCKDADLPSPISVLKPSPTDELSSSTDELSSSSECFEGLNADLQGLRMQLKLLKSESEEYVEGPMEISNDEDGGVASTEKLEGNGWCRIEDSWESSYIFDVLSESGFDEAQPDTILEVWHSLECPMSISVFHELEKRYCDMTSCSRSERRMLFDRINSGIFKIHEQSLCGIPWVSSEIPDFGSQLIEFGLQDGLQRLLLGSRGELNDDAEGKLLVKESQWLDLRDDIDVIGREVERLLFDDLVAEIAGGA